MHVEAGAVYGFADALVGEEVRLEIADRQQRVTHQTPYGSAASRKPSPRKLNARMTTITGTAGNNSQGEIATVWTFWASCSSTPHEMAGGRRPSPRKLSDVSRMTIAGNASVVAAMMW